ncbi:thiamine ABC transporter substrate-binding protein [Hydrogenophaga defluvii]|uniref:Thiamine ABC transporter substrate binding subunit n=1 Tax=Hydrogenophaga defluvii TaxID=249410 RepID=A0ABW2S7P8_9BURK
MATLAALACTPPVRAATPELRVLTHSSFNLPKPLLGEFERVAAVRLQLIKGGDAGEMLNKLILTRAKPIADVVFGIDNALWHKARAANVLDTYDGPAARRPSVAEVGAGVVPVTYGFVNLNADKAWLAREKRSAPTNLLDLTRPEWAGKLVVPNPATSSPGLAFLLATVGGMGEEAAFAWWVQMRANGLKVVKGWSEAYYTEFSRNGGSRPLVVSYASSPAAEVFFSKEKITEPPTLNLLLKGGVFRQVEGVALVRGGGQRAAAGQFIEFLRSPAVQQALQTEMWMLPADKGAAPVAALASVPTPAAVDNPSAETLAANSGQWVTRWTRTVLK